MASSSRSSPAGPVRLRSIVHRGVVEASAVLLDEAIAGPLAARRRAVAAWSPGAAVYRFGGAILVRFPAPRWVDCARSPGLPLVRTGAAPAAPIASAPLTPDEIAALEPPAGAVIVVRGGVPACVVPAASDLEDPAAYLDLSAFATVAVVPLGPAPSPPRVALAPALAPPRRLLGVADAPEAQADAVAALRAARAGEAPPAGERGARPSTLAAFFSTLGTLLARVFSPDRAPRPALPRVGEASRALVAVHADPPRATLADRLRAALGHTFASVLVRARLASLVGRRQAEYLGRMMDLFDRGDLGEALRHAIPLGGDAREGGLPPAPALGVPARRSELAISGRRGSAGAAIFTPDELYADLRRRYRDAFARLEREGRIEEAAFVLAELLRESAEAVAFLERHGRLRLAAEVAEARDLPPDVLVRQWFLAGERARALRIARRHDAFAAAVARLGGHPDAAALRLLWGESLAASGDFALAVAVVWEIPAARRVAEAWIDAALAQGGCAGARMLARKIELFPASFPDVLARVLALVDDDTPGASLERVALAEAFLDFPRAPAARTLARPLARALLRDAGRAEARLPLTLATKLIFFFGDDPLRADLPDLQITARVPLAKLPLRRLAAAATDTGPTPVHDAVHLPDGRTLLALGEAGVRVLARSGRVAFQLDQPAHHLVISDRGDRALALARRGGALRVARLDLVGRRAQVWCEARLDAWADDFDGSAWIVAADGALLVADALEDRLEALASFDVGGHVEAIARNPAACIVGTIDRRLRYELPSWTLRSTCAARESFEETGWMSLPLPHGAAVTPAGAYARFTASAPPSTLAIVCTAEGSAPRFVPLGEGDPLALAARAGWIASAVLTRDGACVRLHDEPTLTLRVEVRLDGATFASVRLSDDALTIADDRGRVLVLDLAHGEVVRDARA